MAILRQSDLDYFLAEITNDLEVACEMLGLNRCLNCNRPATSKDPEQNLTNLHYCPNCVDLGNSLKELDRRLEKIINEG